MPSVFLQYVGAESGFDSPLIHDTFSTPLFFDKGRGYWLQYLFKTDSVPLHFLALRAVTSILIQDSFSTVPLFNYARKQWSHWRDQRSEDGGEKTWGQDGGIIRQLEFRRRSSWFDWVRYLVSKDGDVGKSDGSNFNGTDAADAVYRRQQVFKIELLRIESTPIRTGFIRATQWHS